ncbi:MAG: ABC transporter permease [Chloroflexi bacterium]|nr:ABC transporter permease [Chloroflexota bacterium]
MTTYTIRRVLWVVPVLWAVATITFLLMHAVPGGPFTQDKKLPPAVTAALERRYHFDEPLWKQYTNFLWNGVHGDLGLSVRGDREVTEIIRHTFFVTAQLGVLAFIMAVVLGLSLGTLSALNHNGPLDYIGVGFATLGASVPNFILGAFLVVIFAVNIQIFKVLGWGGPIQIQDVFDSSAYDWRKMVLPVIAVGALPAAYIARVTRASVLEVLSQDYIRTARAKGLQERRVVLRHTIKNALIPVLTVMGPIAANLVTGSFIIETMFGIPGVGKESIDAVVRRDYQVIMGTALFYTLIVTMANLLVDLAYAAVDPRIRYR